MRNALLVLISTLVACSKSPPPAPAAPAPSAGSGSAAAGSGSSLDAEAESYIADFVAYGDKSVVIMAKFDGDCLDVSHKFLELEPLAKHLRQLSDPSTSPELMAAVKGRMKDMQAVVLKHYAELLKPLNLTVDDLDKKESELKTACAGNPTFEDAQERTGLKKKK